MAEHNILGKEGEQYATDFLIEKGYVIRDTNWRSGKREIDIVAENDACLVIVEVKSRSSSDLADPLDAIDKRRVMRLVSAASTYVQSHQIEKDVRFDVISILRDGQKFSIEHIEDAFIAPLRTVR